MSSKKITSKFIKEVIEKMTSLDLVKENRKREVAYVRFVACKLCRELTYEGFEQISKTFNRNHATVIHGINRFNDYTGASFFKEYDDLYRDVKINVLTAFNDEEGYELDELKKMETMKEYYENKIKEINLSKTLQLNNFTDRKLLVEASKLDDETYEKLAVRINAFMELNSRIA